MTNEATTKEQAIAIELTQTLEEVRVVRERAEDLAAFLGMPRNTFGEIVGDMTSGLKRLLVLKAERQGKSFDITQFEDHLTLNKLKLEGLKRLEAEALARLEDERPAPTRIH